MDRDPFDLVGDVLDGQFRVDAFAGEGDLSVVYRGHHLGVDATVAIKCLNLPETLDPALARPLVDGFREASRVHYRLARGNLHIAQTIASGSTLVPRSGVVVPYLVREWYEGESLRSELARRRDEKQSGRPLDEVLALLETAFDGVAYAHAHGEMHLSLNPSNLFVVARTDSTPAALKVLDFGVASTMNAFASGIPSKARPSAGLRLLFPAYAAPEQLDRTVGGFGPWTDVYALALVMMEMLSDRVVMAEADSGAIVEHALDEQRRPTPQAHGLKLPSHVDRALVRAVARTPERRQKNAAELWKDVRNSVRTLAPRPMSAAPPRVSLTPQPFPSRAPLAMASLPEPAQPLPTPAPTRVRSPTLVGLSAPVAPVAPALVPGAHANGVSVPGAIGNRFRLPSTPSIATRPMSFEPKRASSMPLPPVPPVPSVPAPPVMTLPPLPLPPLPTPSRPPQVQTALQPASSGDPPPAAPSASGPIEPWPLPLRRQRDVVEVLRSFLRSSFLRSSVLRSSFLRSPEAKALVLPVAGGLFWTALGVVFLLLATAPLRRPTESTPATTTPAAAAVPIPTASPTTDRVAPPAPPVPESPPASAPTAAPVSPVAATSSSFRSDRAVRALDAKWRDVAKCRRGKTWGKGSTTITFAGDGSVSHVEIGSPFAGTPTADCIAEKLGGARMDPFGDEDATLVYKVYVAPH
jgi:serine/threonine protein kinase